MENILTKMIGDVWEDFWEHSLSDIVLNRLFLDDKLVQSYCDNKGLSQNQLKESYDLKISQRFSLEQVETRQEEIKEDIGYYLDKFKKTGKIYI